MSQAMSQTMCQAHGPTCQTLRAAGIVARNATWTVTVLVPYMVGLHECAAAAAEWAGVAVTTELVEGYVRAQFGLRATVAPRALDPLDRLRRAAAPQHL